MSKIIDSGADMTMFGQLTNLEKKTITINNRLCSDIDTIKEMQINFLQMEKEAKTTTNDTKLKLTEEAKKLQQKIKNMLSLQKIENQRFAGQIVEMSQNSKQIATQLEFLHARFQEFQKNVYGAKIN